MNVLLFQITYWVLFISSCISTILFFYRKGTTRTILGIESMITGIASCVYYVYLQRIKTDGFGLNGLIPLRYLDWLFTTPLMLLSISYLFSKNLNIALPVPVTLWVIFLDILMLAFGYAGEMNLLEKNKAQLIGFIPFVMMFAILYNTYFRGPMNIGNISILSFYLVLWTLYGVVYLLPEEQVNDLYTILDAVSKGIFSLAVSYFL